MAATIEGEREIGAVLKAASDVLIVGQTVSSKFAKNK
jgi:hypothetical protein